MRVWVSQKKNNNKKKNPSYALAGSTKDQLCDYERFNSYEK